MKFRETAAYNTNETFSGIEAMLRYQKVAIKR